MLSCSTKFPLRIESTCLEQFSKSLTAKDNSSRVVFTGLPWHFRWKLCWEDTQQFRRRQVLEFRTADLGKQWPPWSEYGKTGHGLLETLPKKDFPGKSFQRLYSKYIASSRDCPGNGFFLCLTSQRRGLMCVLEDLISLIRCET